MSSSKASICEQQLVKRRNRHYILLVLGLVTVLAGMIYSRVRNASDKRWTSEVLKSSQVASKHTEPITKALVVRPLDNEDVRQEWLAEATRFSFVPVNSIESDQCRALLAPEIAKYPQHILDAALSEILIVESMRFSSVEAAGTAHNTVVILAVMGNSRTLPSSYIVQTFHSEFGSLLLRRYKTDAFPLDEWMSQLPPSFSYSENQLDVIRQRDNAAILTSTPDLLELGFVHAYGMSSLEEDVCSYMADRMMGRPRLGDGVTIRVRTKAALVDKFFCRISTQFEFCRQ